VVHGRTEQVFAGQTLCTANVATAGTAGVEQQSRLLLWLDLLRWLDPHLQRA
jgi:hypothetical protein